MRFFVQHKKENFISLLVILFSTVFYLFIIFSVWLKLESNQFFPSDLVLDIKGNPDEFIEPKEIVSLVEEIHVNLFLNLIALLSISGILFRTLINHNFKIFLTFSGFLAVILYPLSILGIKFLCNCFGIVSFISYLFLIFVFFIVNSINLISFLTGKFR
jgi:hypothetical protein